MSVELDTRYAHIAGRLFALADDVLRRIESCGAGAHDSALTAIDRARLEAVRAVWSREGWTQGDMERALAAATGQALERRARSRGRVVEVPSGGD